MCLFSVAKTMNFIKNFLSHFQNNDGSSTETPKAGELNPDTVSGNINHITDVNEDLLTSQSSDEIPTVIEANDTNSNAEMLAIDDESLFIDDAKSKKVLENYNIDETLINLDDFEDLLKDNISTIKGVANSQDDPNYIENEEVIVNLDEFENMFELVNDIEVNREVTKPECKASTTEEVYFENIVIDDSTESPHVLQIDGNKDNVSDIQFANRVTQDDHNYSVCNDIHMPGKNPKHYLDEFKSFLKNKDIEAKTKTYFVMTNVSPNHLNANNFDSENNPETFTNSGYNATDAKIDILANQGKIIHEVIESQNETSISKGNGDMGKEGSVIILFSEDDSNSIQNETKAYDNISISSSEDERVRADSDYCSGYNSSDFEFITESEAKLDGLIINLTSKNLKTPEKRHKPGTYTVEIAKDANYASGSSQESVKEVEPGPSHSNLDLAHNYAQGQHYKDGLSNKNIPATSTTKPKDGTYKEKNYSYDYKRYLIQESKRQRQNHVLPQGEEYLNLFHGMNMPLVSELHFLENKSVRPRTCMNLEYDGIGFDMRLVKKTSDSDDECK